MAAQCRNGHQLWTSWTGSTGCLEDDCPYKRTVEPANEIIPDRHGKRLLCPEGHPSWLGWRRKGCLDDDCEHRIPDLPPPLP